MTYHSSTIATFRPLDLEVARALVAFAGLRSNLGRTISIDGRDYTFEHISHSTSAFWRSRGLSLYFRSGRSVVRISDHWSESLGNDRSRKLNCGSVGSSHWSIRNRADSEVWCHSHGGGRFPYRMLAGICALKSFQHVA